MIRSIRAKATGHLLTLDEALKDLLPPVLWLLDALPEGIACGTWSRHSAASSP